MQKRTNTVVRGVISMEEYIKKRKKLRETEADKRETEEKSPAWMMAELYV